MEFFTGLLTNLLVGFVSAILLVFNTAPIDKTQSKIDLTDYVLTFADEFEGDALDHNIWEIRSSDRPVRRGGYWSIDQTKVKDGNLVITTEYKPDGEYGAGWYTAGITTENRFEQTYGYYECRCILPKGNGLWSAFWLTNENVGALTTGNARKGAEIDVFESPYYHLGEGKRNKVTSNIHYNGYSLLTRYKNVAITKLDNNPYEEYNTYGLKWTKDEYIYYINGYEVGRSAYGGVSGENEYMLLSCEVEGAEARTTNGWSGNIETNGKDFSTEFKVDYVRVYQKKEANTIIDRNEIVNLYKSAAEKTDADEVLCHKQLTFKDAESKKTAFDKFMKTVFPGFEKEYSGDIDRITGDYKNLTVNDISAAKATIDGKYTTIQIQLRDQCDFLDLTSFNPVGHGIDTQQNVKAVIESIDGVKFDFAEDGGVMFVAFKPKITVKIDNETGKIVSGQWSYTLYTDIYNAVATGADFTENVDYRRYTFDYTVTL